MKQAKIQWGGNRAYVFDEATGKDLFNVNLVLRADDLCAFIKTKAAKLGYATQQIYAGKDGIVRIWL